MNERIITVHHASDDGVWQAWTCVRLTSAQGAISEGIAQRIEKALQRLNRSVDSVDAQQWGKVEDTINIDQTGWFKKVVAHTFRNWE
jgi:hypothetical protein